MVNYCRICGLPFEPLKIISYIVIIAGYGYAILQRNHTEAAIEEINRKARALGLSYGQMVQKYKL